MTVMNFIDRLRSCPKGQPGWKMFEDICIDILRYIFVPPLSQPIIQSRTYSGMDKRDAIFPNRNRNSSNNWGLIFQDLDSRYILFEFKNYNTEIIGKDEVDQVRNYLKDTMGRLAILCCNKEPHRTAYRRRNSIFSSEKKVILFLTPDQLEEMLFIKERGEDPVDLILDMIDKFYLQQD